jgi:small neutral amino acid transporter SnatA (MarC family)
MGSAILPLKISQDHSSLGKFWLFYLLDKFFYLLGEKLAKFFDITIFFNEKKGGQDLFISSIQGKVKSSSKSHHLI